MTAGAESAVVKHCMIVDDSRVIRRVAVKMVEDLGFGTSEAEDGRKALALCKAQLPDAIILDWEMPHMDGIAFTDELRKLPGGNRVLVVMCTVKNDPESITQALDAGVDEYIMKPFDGDIVRAKFQLLGLLG